jgi:S1-C subfamily serine protease
MGVSFEASFSHPAAPSSPDRGGATPRSALLATSRFSCDIGPLSVRFAFTVAIMSESTLRSRGGAALTQSGLGGAGRAPDAPSHGACWETLGTLWPILRTFSAASVIITHDRNHGDESGVQFMSDDDMHLPVDPAGVDHPTPWSGTSGGPTPPRRRGGQALALVALVVLAGAAGGALATYLNHGAPSAVSDLLHSKLGVTSSQHLSTAAIAAKIEPSVVDVNVTLAYGQGQAEGTGMILTPSGRILTNNHVVEGAGTISVRVPGRGTYRARVVGVDPKDDVAVLQLLNAPDNLPTMPFGNSATVQIGERVVAIGNALGLGGPPSVTAGAITALGRDITASNDSGGSEHLFNMLQTDAPLQPGDSGGPLVDSAGQVIGMDTAAETSSGVGLPTGASNTAPSSIAFSIPIDRALRIASEIVKGQASSQIVLTRSGFLGVEVSDASSLPPYVQQQLGTTSGAVVVAALPGTPAAKAGITQYDVVTSVDGQAVTNIQQLGALIKAHKPGTDITVVWIGPNGNTHTATVTLTSAPVA